MEETTSKVLNESQNTAKDPTNNISNNKKMKKKKQVPKRFRNMKMNPNFGSKKSGWIDTESESPPASAAKAAATATNKGNNNSKTKKKKRQIPKRFQNMKMNPKFGSKKSGWIDTANESPPASAAKAAANNEV